MGGGHLVGILSRSAVSAGSILCLGARFRRSCAGLATRAMVAESPRRDRHGLSYSGSLTTGRWSGRLSGMSTLRWVKCVRIALLMLFVGGLWAASAPFARA